jgi:hypothetical protein
MTSPFGSPPWPRWPVHAALVASALVTAACMAAPPPTDADRVLAAREALSAAIGDAACSEALQCRTVPIGHQACGGPEAWLAWSSAAGNGAQIDALAASHRAARRTMVERLGLQSTCAVVPDPGARCRAGRCQLRTGADNL